MKSVLLSIQPKYCELIASGRKTVEIRKTRPKIETPFKCYIYETKGKTETPFVDEDGHMDFHGRGQVIGEFICDNILYWQYFWSSDVTHICEMSEMSCVSEIELLKYAGGKQRFYGWHISDFVLYDKPKELAEFKKPCKETNLCYPDNCNRCGWNILLRPPQSWCYVEEQEG